MQLLLCLLPNVAVCQLQLKGFACEFGEPLAEPATRFIISPRRIRMEDAYRAEQSGVVGGLI